MPRVSLLLWGVLGACHPAPKSEVEPEPSDADACGTWSSVGEPFTLTWCAGCHSSQLPADRRYGAPVGTDLDTLDAVIAQSAAVRSSLDGGRMPPAGGVPAAEQAAFLAWLECGAPGEPHRLTPGSPSVSALGGDFLFGGFGEPDPGSYYAYFMGGTFEELEMRYVPLDGGGVGLTSWSLSSEEGGRLGGAVFEPPIRLWPPVDTVQHTERRQIWEGVAVDDEVDWEIAFTVDPDPDPRFADTDILLTRVDDGAGMTIEFWTSSLYGLQALDLAYGPLSGGRRDRMLMLSASPPMDRGESYPQQPGDAFLIRRTVLLEPL